MIRLFFMAYLYLRVYQIHQTNMNAQINIVFFGFTFVVSMNECRLNTTSKVKFIIVNRNYIIKS